MFHPSYSRFLMIDRKPVLARELIRVRLSHSGISLTYQHITTKWCERPARTLFIRANYNNKLNDLMPKHLAVILFTISAFLLISCDQAERLKHHSIQTSSLFTPMMSAMEISECMGPNEFRHQISISLLRKESVSQMRTRPHPHARPAGILC
jgi:hypothetical protein